MITAIYRSPATEIKPFIYEMNSYDDYDDSMIVGDMNIDLLRNSESIPG